MSQNERSGERSLVYSQWHRAKSISRFIDPNIAPGMHMSDIDFVEYIGLRSLFMCEETRQWIDDKDAAGINHKHVLAAKAGIAHITIQARHSDRMNPAALSVPDIHEFHVRCDFCPAHYGGEWLEAWINKSPVQIGDGWRSVDAVHFTPEEWAKTLFLLRQHANQAQSAEQLTTGVIPTWRCKGCLRIEWMSHATA